MYTNTLLRLLCDGGNRRAFDAMIHPLNCRLNVQKFLETFFFKQSKCNLNATSAGVTVSAYLTICNVISILIKTITAFV